MKKYLLLLLIGMMVPVNLGFTQQETLTERLNRIKEEAAGPKAPAPPELPRFDLDFRGGTPKQMVQAIEKATGKPLNAIIPDEDADLQLPPLSVKNVTVPRLFHALELSSEKTETLVTGTYSGAYGGTGTSSTYQNMRTRYGFKTDGDPTENSIWYFYYDKLPKPPQSAEKSSPPACKFYQLSGYLEAGYKVEDITTAIETGWKMLGETNPPKISYHKDTRLLIAVGDESKLGLIQDVLNHLVLEKPKAKTADTQNSDKPKDK